MFSKLKSKVTAQRFVFTFHIHVLTPWPAGDKAIAIGWQRGKRRRGATRAVLPTPVPGRLSNAIKFNESFDIPATLYKSSSGAATPFGSFKKKCVILAVLETDGRTQATAALGRVVIDLSEFASVDGQELRTFLVSCSKSIHAAVGEPQLTVTVRCRWKKAATVDKGGDNSSMSTDTTGSTMTANLGSFMGLGRRGGSRQQPAPPCITGIPSVSAPNEQDLRGFQARDLAPIHEDEDERSRLSPTSSRDSSPNKGRPRAVSAPPARPNRRTFEPDEEEEGGSDGKGGKANNTRQERQQLKEVGRSRVSDWLGSPAKSAPAPNRVAHSSVGSAATRPGMGVEEAPAPRAGLPPRGAPAPQSRYSRPAMPASPAAPVPTPFVVAAHHDDGHGDHSSDSEDMKSPLPRPPLPQHSTSPRAETVGKWRNRWSRNPSSDSLEAAAAAEPPKTISASADFKSFSLASVGSLEPTRSLESGNGVGRGASQLASPRGSFMRRQSSLSSEKMSDRDSGAEAKEVVKLRALKQELVSAAAVEASVYMARARAATSNDALRHVHTCARRLSRTIVCMGQSEGLAFARYSLHAIGHLIDTGHEDVEGMMWYWSNIVHMRGFMQSLNLAQAAKASAMGQPHLGAQGHWAANALVEPLSLLEQRIFLQLLNYVWSQVLIPLVSPAAGRPASPLPSRQANHKGIDERAVQRWIEALDAVAWRLGLSNPHSHIPLLRQQILMQILKRIDNLLLGYMLYSTGSLDHHLVSVSRDNPGLKVPSGFPLVDEAVLPFRRGPLTFGAGMNMKMAVTRLQQWAFETVLMGDTVAGSMEGLSLFPHMRAAADLLMMPKELLMDRGIRSDVCSCLPVPAIIAIISSFQPDEFAQDMVAPEVIVALRKEAGPRASTAPAVPSISETVYSPPTDDVVMEAVESGREPGLEYGDDSETELLDMAKMAAPGSSKKALRYKMLHELWATGVPRKRAYTTHH